MAEVITTERYDDLYDELTSCEDGFDYDVMNKIKEEITLHLEDNSDKLTLAMMHSLISLFISIAWSDIDYDFNQTEMESELKDYGDRLSALVLMEYGA